MAVFLPAFSHFSDKVYSLTKAGRGHAGDLFWEGLIGSCLVTVTIIKGPTKGDKPPLGQRLRVGGSGWST